MTRAEFRLSMPGRGSWNGRWSSEDRNLTILRALPDRRAGELLGVKGRAFWSYNFGDGWLACVDARVVPKGERIRKSDGFCGYDWMVESIIADGDIYGPTRAKPVPAPDTKGDAP